MNKSIMIRLVLLVSALLALGACAPAPTSVPTAPTTAPVAPSSLPAAPTTAPVAPTTVPVAPTSVPAASTAAPAAAAVTVTDSVGRKVTVAGAPSRIVTLAPSVTEIAFALGLGNRLVAVDSNSDYPAEVKALPKFSTYPLSYEQLVSFKPDLILAAGLTSPDDVKRMEELKLTVLVVGSANMSFDQVAADILMAGRATGTEAKAQAVGDAIKQKVAAVKARIANAKSKPRVYWELDATDPARPFTPGPGSFLNDLIAVAGGENVAAKAKSAWAQINAEEIVSANPDLIILSDANYGVTPEAVKARAGWSAIAAVKNGRVLPIDENIVSRTGPRIADGLEAAARLIHPELFP